MSKALKAMDLDDLATQVLTSTLAEAEKAQQHPTFEALMDEVETVPMHRRKYTAAEFFLRQQEKWKAVVGYLAESRGQLWIAERVGCSHHTVRAVRDHFPRAVAIEKERLADTCQRGAARLADMILEEPEKLPPNTWAMTLGILVDKSLALRGGPSLTIEHRHTFTHGDFNALVAAAPARDIEATVMGSDAEKELAMAIPPAPSDLTQDGPHPASTDAESLDSQRTDAPAPLPATLPTPGATGAGGVPISTGGGRPEEGT